MRACGLGPGAGGDAACPCVARYAPPPASIKMLDFSSLCIASIVPLMPSILRPATTSRVRRPTDAGAAKYPIENDGGRAIQVMELSCFWDSELWATGFGAPDLGPLGLGRRVWGGAACPCGARCAPPPGGERVGFAVLSPPRTILSQALVSHGEEGNCSLRPLPCPLGKGRCRCAGSTLFALRAKALQSGAPHFGVSRKKQGFGAFYPSGKIPGAPGGRETGFSPQGTEFFPHAVCSTFSQ